MRPPSKFSTSTTRALIAIPSRESCGGYQTATVCRDDDGTALVSFCGGHPWSAGKCEAYGALIVDAGIRHYFLPHPGTHLAKLDAEGVQMVWPGSLEDLLRCEFVAAVLVAVLVADDEQVAYDRLERGQILPRILPILRASGRSAEQLLAESDRLRGTNDSNRFPRFRTMGDAPSHAGR